MAVDVGAVLVGDDVAKVDHVCAKERCKHFYCLKCSKCKYGCTQSEILQIVDERRIKPTGIKGQ